MSLSPAWNAARANKIFSKREILKLLAFAAAFIAAAVTILEMQFFPSAVSQLKVGDIAPQDIIAPDAISYQSELATEAKRDLEENQVPLYYSRPNPEAAREQRQTADSVLSFLDAIRADPDPTLSADEKLDWIQQIEPVSLTRQEAAAILNLPESLWLDAKQEIRSVLDFAMRQEIRDSQLISVRRRLNLLISPDVPDAEAAVVAAIVEDLIQPNTFVDEEKTAEERQSVREAVEPVFRTLEKGEVVVRAGERVNQETIEALQAMGLQQPETRWQSYAATFLYITLLTVLLSIYLVKYQFSVLKDNRKLIFLSVTMLVFVAAARAMVPHTILSYALPTAALTMMVAALIDSQLALMITLIMGLIASYIGGGSLEMLIYVIFGGFIVALNVGKLASLNNLLWAGLYVAVSNTIVILMFRFFGNSFESLDLLTRLGSGWLNGVLSAGLSLLLFFVLGNLTDTTTYIQLMELSRPTHPLLSELLRRAPGTYHHSLLVGNLAENAAESIGANAFLCRVGAYYHDVGKMLRPYFFTENTPPGMTSLHDSLEPEVSAKIIIGHVTDGLELAKKHRLPSVIRAFIAEHHGTEMVRYFYHKAVQKAEAAGGSEADVDKSAFTYPGPIPQTKETAILMLADASEATVRSVEPQSSAEIDQIIRRTIDNRMKSGQLDDCDLTMHDLEQIRLAFIDVLQGVSHPRIKYPEQIETKIPDTGPLPPLPLAVQGALPAPQNTPSTAPASLPVQKE